MKVDKSKLIAALLTLLGVAYLGVLVYLAINTDNSDTAMTILYVGICAPIIIGVLYGMFLDIIE